MSIVIYSPGQPIGWCIELPLLVIEAHGAKLLSRRSRRVHDVADFPFPSSRRHLIVAVEVVLEVPSSTFHALDCLSVALIPGQRRSGSGNQSSAEKMPF